MCATLGDVRGVICIAKICYVTKDRTLFLLVSTVNIAIYHSKTIKDLSCINLDVEETYVQEHPRHPKARSETIDLKKDGKDFQSYETALHFKTQT